MLVPFGNICLQKISGERLVLHFLASSIDRNPSASDMGLALEAFVLAAGSAP